MIKTVLPHKLNKIEYESHLSLRCVSSCFHSFFCDFHTNFFLAYPVNPKGLVFYIFQGLIHIFKDDFTKFQDKMHFFGIPGVFQEKKSKSRTFPGIYANPGQVLMVIFA